MSSPIGLSPQERLAVSRKAIVRHMSRHYPEVEERLSGKLESSGKAVTTLGHGRVAQIKNAALMWWHRHPASAVADLAAPLLNGYAKAHPFKLLGISVFAGAVFVLIRPWRMMSVSALLIAAVKSSGLSNTLLTMLSSLAHNSGNADTST